jgi:hypothetical protein
MCVVPTVLKRTALSALVLVGLLVTGVGFWFAVHLGSSGSGTFTARPEGGRVVVLEPTVLNRVDRPVTVTARAREGAEVWIGRAAPSDVRALVGDAARATVTGVDIAGWELRAAGVGTGRPPALGTADIWREEVSGAGVARVSLDQTAAPEALVVATASGAPAALESLTVTWQDRTWFHQALLTTLVGMLVTATAATALWRQRPQPVPVPVHTAERVGA